MLTTGIDLSIIEHMPGFAAAKSANHEYIASTDAGVKISGFQKRSQMYGKTDDQLPWAENFDIYRKTDHLALQGEVVNALYPMKFENGKKPLFRNKKFRMQTSNQENIIINVSSIVSINQAIRPEINLTNEDLFTKAGLQTPVLYIEKAIPGLTDKQMEILYLYIRDYPADEIATKININLKIIEENIELIKSILLCNSKNDVIDLAHEKGYITLLPVSFLRATDEPPREKTTKLIQPNVVYQIARTEVEFSTRQAQCLNELVRGLTAKEIAKVLQLSYRTVEDYITTLKAKLNCKNKTELVAKILEQIEEC